MLYDYQYAVAAIIANLMLILIVLQKRSYTTRSNRTFMRLLVLNLCTTVADLFTFFTISYPARFSETVLYASNVLYLLLYASMSALVAIYTG